MAKMSPSATNAEREVSDGPSLPLSGRLLVGNAVWNLIGLCTPSIVAIFCLPLLEHHLGADRLGILTLAWVVVGYFGLFDFGLSRALTKLVAEKVGKGQPDQISGLVWTALISAAGIGLGCMMLAFFLSPWLVRSVVKVPPDLRNESLAAFYWLSISIPIVILTATLRGVLEGLQRFKLATAIRIPMGAFNYLGPVLVLPFSRSLVPIVAALVTARAVGFFAHFWACSRALPGFAHSFEFMRSAMGPLFRFGTWMSLSSIAGSVMVSFDRFVIGATLSVAAVAYYAVPSEVVIRLLWIPLALIGVMFPAFSATHSGQRDRLTFLYESSVKLVCISLLPLLLALVAFAPEILRIWLGSDFAKNSTWVVRCLAIGIFITGAGQVAFAHVQGAGRPDITAKLLILELPLYIACLFFFVKLDGIRGAALAWTLRVSADTVLLFALSRKIAPENRFIATKVPLLLGGGVLFLLMVSFDMPATLKIVSVISAALISALLVWQWALSPRERSLVISQIRRHHVA